MCFFLLIVDNFTKELVKALRVSPTDCSMTRCTLHTGHGLCDTCSAQHSKHLSTVNESDRHVEEIAVGEDAVDPAIVSVCNTTLIDSQAEEKLNSIVLLEEVGESSTDPYITGTSIVYFIVIWLSMPMRLVLTLCYICCRNRSQLGHNIGHRTTKNPHYSHFTYSCFGKRTRISTSSSATNRSETSPTSSLA